MQELIKLWQEYSKENLNQYGHPHPGSIYLEKLRSFEGFMDWLVEREINNIK